MAGGIAPPAPQTPVVLRLGVTGKLGEMDLVAVLNALQAGVTLLQRTAHRVLGGRAEGVQWRLTGLREGSVTALATAEGISISELRAVASTYVRDLQHPTDRLLDEDVALLKELLEPLEQTGSGSFAAGIEGAPDDEEALLAPHVVLPLLIDLPPERHQVIGSVVGKLDGLNLHGRREAGLYDDLDGRRVVVTFPETLYEQVIAAMRARVEAFGLLTEDADGRPMRVRLQSIEAMTADDELPTLSSLVGSVPELTGGLSAAEYLERSRRKIGLG